MNSSVPQLDTSNLELLVETVKASVSLLDFIICSLFSVLIIRTVRKSSEMRKEVRYFLLSHHLSCLTVFFGIGAVFSGIRALKLNAPRLLCWIIFAMMITAGRGIMLTLALMSLNACVAICWPLKYLSIVNLVKFKLTVCVWVFAMLDPLISLIYESTTSPPGEILQLDPSCPTSLNGIPARIAGIVFILLLMVLIILSYVLIYREAKRAGHFNSTNTAARNTIIIHGFQITLHIIPTLIAIGIGRSTELLALNLANFIIFSFAQCFSPVVYGLRCKELQCKLLALYRNGCCFPEITSSNVQLQLTPRNSTE
ncbi:odorant receptor 131-2-like [Ambystoma mexicanum]|uniref:odorant receptor 131-2-like n=1 Tax=Ambystoma mexicanum TaxID=8296 RepID=UPI0037E882BC